MAYSPLRAGDLNRRIAFRRAADVPDGKGGFDTTWPEIARCWAQVTSQNGREALIAGALQGVSAYRIVIRYRRDLLVSDQIMYDGRILNIRTIDDPFGRRDRLIIYADTANAQAVT